MRNPIADFIAEARFRMEVPRDLRLNGCCGCGEKVATWHYEGVPVYGPDGEALNPVWKNCDDCHQQNPDMHRYNHWRI